MFIPAMKDRQIIILAALLLILSPFLLTTIACDSSGDGTTVTATIRNENQPLNIGVSDGASLEIPPGALPVGTVVKMEVLTPEEAPPLPRGFESALKLYDISADHSLQREVEIRLPLPKIDVESIAMLFRYSEGEWVKMNFDVDGDFAVVSADLLSFWGWLDINVENFRQRGDQFLMTILDPDTYIEPIMKRFDELTGLVRYTDIGLESNSPLVNFDERHTYDLISASAASVDNDLLRLRVRNNNNFYLMLYFDGYGEVVAQRGSYLDIKSLQAVAPQLGFHVIYWLIENLPQNFILLLPEGTAEFHAPYHPGERLVIRFRLDEASAVYSSLDPLLGLVPIANVEIITAMRDIMGAGSRYVENLNNLEKSIYVNILDATDIRNTLLRAGVLIGEKALRQLLSSLVLPKVVEMRKDILEGRVIDILENGPQAKKGGRLTLDYLAMEIDYSEVADFVKQATSFAFINYILPLFEHPNELSNDDLILALTLNDLIPYQSDDTCSSIIHGDVVQKTARRVFGPHIKKIEHRSVFPYDWHSNEHLYRVVGFGPGSYTETYVLSIDETETNYIVDVAHAIYYYGLCYGEEDCIPVFYVHDELGNYIANLAEYDYNVAKNVVISEYLPKFPIRRYILNKELDGNYYIMKSYFLN